MNIFKTDVSIENIRLDVIMTNDIMFSNGSSTSIFHSHAHYDLHYITSGTFIFRIENKEYVATKNTLVLIAPQTYHSVSCADPENQCSKVSLELFITKRNKGADLFDKHISDFKSVNDFLLTLAEMTEFYDMQWTIQNCYGAELIHRLNSLITIIFFKVCNLIKPSNFKDIQSLDRLTQLNNNDSDDDYTKIAQILYFISSHYSNALTVTDFENHLHISSKQINRITKKYMNSSVLSLVNSFRIKKAQDLIEKLSSSDKNNDTLNKISLCVGFQNYNYFYTQFKEQTGTSPSDYMNKFKK